MRKRISFLTASVCLLLAACLYRATMADAIAKRQEATKVIYPLGEDRAWQTAIDTLRATGGGTIEEHRDQHMMLTTSLLLAAVGTTGKHLAAATAPMPPSYTQAFPPPVPPAPPPAPIYRPTAYMRYIAVWVQAIDGGHSQVEYSASPPSTSLEREFHEAYRRAMAGLDPSAAPPPKDTPERLQACSSRIDCEYGVCIEGYCRR